MVDIIQKLWDFFCGHRAWRVTYKDGEVSTRMSYKVAKGYAEIFSGHVHWVGEETDSPYKEFQ